MKKVVVVDFDGTLVDPKPRDYRLYVDIMKVLGQRPLTFGEYWPLRYESTPIEEILRLTWDEPNKKRFTSMRSEMCELEGYVAMDVAFPDVHSTLFELRTCMGLELHLISARLKLTTLIDEVKRLGLDHHLDDVLVAPSSKYDSISRLKNVVAVIGDTEHDVNPARSLGIKAIAVTTGIRSHRLLSTFGADVIIESLSEARGLICA